MSTVWADFTIYKGKTALSFSPILPKFKKTEVCWFFLFCELWEAVIMLQYLEAIWVINHKSLNIFWNSLVEFMWAKGVYFYWNFVQQFQVKNISMIGESSRCVLHWFLFMTDESIFDWIDARSSSLWLIILMNSYLLIFLNIAFWLRDISVAPKFLWSLFSLFLASLITVSNLLISF